jgi:hypothetical protein
MSTEPTTCPSCNARGDGAYCGSCGTQLPRHPVESREQVPSPALSEAVNEPTAPMRPQAPIRRAALGWWAWPMRYRVLSGVAAVIVVVGIASATANSSGSNSADQSAPSNYAVPQMTANQQCENDVYNAAADMVNNGNSGFMNEMAVGGQANPVFRLAQQVMVVFNSELYQQGRMTAESDARSKAQEMCATNNNPNNSAYGGTPYTAPVG